MCNIKETFVQLKQVMLWSVHPRYFSFKTLCPAPEFQFNTDCSGKYAEELSDLYDSSEDYLVDGILHCGYCGQPYTECMC